MSIWVLLQGPSNKSRHFMIIISAKFFRIFTNSFAKAIALFPFILLNSKSLRFNKTVINHERIHLKQQLELLVIPFYFWYVIEFILRWIKYKHFRTAYEKISFEREAFTNEVDLKYLNKRSSWAFLHYL